MAKKKEKAKAPAKVKKRKVYKRPNNSKVVYTKDRQHGASSKFHDETFKALPPGKRKTNSGAIYYEYRKNHTDRKGTLNGFFNTTNIESLDDLKKLYWNLSKKLHPDTPSGNEAEFKQMQSEYEELTNNFLKYGGFAKTEATNEIKIDEAYMEVVHQAMKLPLITIEVVGTWIWISGNTFPVRQDLKSLGFQFAPIKKMWYINTTGTKTKKGNELDMDSIRKKYSSTKLKGSNDNFLSGINDYIKPADKLKFKKALSKLVRTMKARK